MFLWKNIYHGAERDRGAQGEVTRNVSAKSGSSRWASILEIRA